MPSRKTTRAAKAGCPAFPERITKAADTGGFSAFCRPVCDGIVGDLCKKALPSTAGTQTQVFGYFPPPIPPDFTQIPP